MPGKAELSHYTIREALTQHKSWQEIFLIVLLVKANIMKWRYQNEEEKEEETQQIVTINASPAGGGGVTKIVENNLYFRQLMLTTRSGNLDELMTSTQELIDVLNKK